MRLYAIIIALSVVFAMPAWSAKERHQVGIVPHDVPEMQDNSKEPACNCCRKCQAAKGSMESEHEEGAEESDGCEDCCARCGRELKPGTEESPPEIIKSTPPDIKHKE